MASEICDEAEKCLAMFRAGKSKSEIAREMNTDKRRVEKLIVQAIKRKK